MKPTTQEVKRDGKKVKFQPNKVDRIIDGA